MPTSRIQASAVGNEWFGPARNPVLLLLWAFVAFVIASALSNSLAIARMRKGCRVRQQPFPFSNDLQEPYPKPIPSRNSMLCRVFFSLFNINSIASTGGTPVKARRSRTTRLYSSG